MDYFFVSNEKFEQLIKQDEFYEHAKIFENYYGTSKKFVDETIKKMIFYLILIGKVLNNYQDLKILT